MCQGGADSCRGLSSTNMGGVVMRPSRCVLRRGVRLGVRRRERERERERETERWKKNDRKEDRDGKNVRDRDGWKEGA